jgi:hypothetical protein
LLVWGLLFFEVLLQGVNVLNLRTYLSDLPCCIAHVQPLESDEESSEDAKCEQNGLKQGEQERAGQDQAPGTQVVAPLGSL